MFIELALATISLAATDSNTLHVEPASWSEPQPATQPAAASTTLETAPARVPFGTAESRWWTVGIGVAHDFNESTDVELYGAYTYFLVDDVEFTAEAAGWFFNQPGEDTGGASLSMIFRWHFINRDGWTVYLDAGVGVLVAGDDVPADRDGVDGTPVAFLPRAGFGITKELTDSGTRLQVGLTWHHISNARISGDNDNPARDSPMLYAGIIWPF